MGWGEARCWAWIGASRQEEAGWKPAPTQEGRGVGTNAFRAEEAGWKPAPTKDGGATRDGGAGVVRGERPGRPRRLREYDYAQDGAYSVTVCTDWRTHLFGRVTDGRMELNAVGRIVEKVWHELPEHYPHVELDAFVVMPDHVHGIVVFVGGDSEAGSDSGPTLGSVTVGSRPEEAGLKPARTQDGTRPEEAGLKPAPTQEGARPEEAGLKPARARTQDEAPTKVRRHGLSEVVRGFKTYSGRRVNGLRGTPGVAVWQRGYYEHVVRNEEDMNRIRQYFQENPLRWSLKRENQELEARGPRGFG